MSLQQKFRGVFTALVTPMTINGEVDWATLGRLVEAQIAAGIDGLVPVGTTGESPTLDTDEHIQVIAAVVEAAAGRVPVIAGTGANSTSEALHLTREADLAGADGFLQVAPYYNKPSQEGVFQHFAKIADSTGKPIILYSIPGRCGIEIAVETVARLAKACPNIRTIKEAGGDVRRVHSLRQACPEVTVLSGDDGLIPSFVAAGAEGVISVASNFQPEVIKELTGACLSGDTAKAAELVAKWESLLTTLVFLDGNPVTIKEVLFQAGIIPHPTVRLPLVRTTEANQAKLREVLQSLNLLPA
ncbi:MAG TPA: 4-hydroxy-tetrahydrodipicolinate synthase [Oceanipulchritudo sp.]|nr:4-hydroxy-tetrahydrodipicolinate synthase [Oceanipulchritudo sp.]